MVLRVACKALGDGCWEPTGVPCSDPGAVKDPGPRWDDPPVIGNGERPELELLLRDGVPELLALDFLT